MNDDRWSWDWADMLMVPVVLVLIPALFVREALEPVVGPAVRRWRAWRRG